MRRPVTSSRLSLWTQRGATTRAWDGGLWEEEGEKNDVKLINERKREYKKI